jgi:ABC-2 type transport system ATP-binding protein
VPSLLEVVAVAKRFGAARAVDDVSLEVAPGEVVGLLGPNGAGKSTTLRMIAGLVRPDRGQIRIDGHDLLTDRLATLRAGGFLIDGPALPSELTCRQALRYLRLLDGPGVSRARAGEGTRPPRARTPGRVDDVLAQVGLAEAADKRVRHLSQGMKQRLGIAGALLGQPRLLVLDEPMNGLDPAGTRELGLLFRQLAAAGAGLLVSSHLLDEVERTSDRVAVMARGKLAAILPVDAAAPGALARQFRALTGELAADSPPGERPVPQAPPP